MLDKGSMVTGNQEIYLENIIKLQLETLTICIEYKVAIVMNGGDGILSFCYLA